MHHLNNVLRGKTIVLISMADDPNPVPAGTEGIITSVDDSGQIHVNWANGQSLAISPEYGDQYTIIEEI